MSRKKDKMDKAKIDIANKLNLKKKYRYLAIESDTAEFEVDDPDNPGETIMSNTRVLIDADTEHSGNSITEYWGGSFDNHKVLYEEDDDKAVLKRKIKDKVLKENKDKSE